MQRRRGVVVLLVVVLLAVVRPMPAQPQQDAPLAAVQKLVDARAAAERNHDRAAFAKTIDPKAPAAFRDAQLKGFDGLASLPVESLDFEVRTDLIGDLTHAVNRAEYGNARVYLPQTIRLLRFRLDAGRPSLDDMWWTYVERDGQWYVGGNDDVTDLGLEPTISMWDLGPVVPVTSEHVMLIAHPEQQERARALLAITENALGTIAQRWTLPWAGHLVGFLPASPEELTTIIQATVDVTKFVAFVSYAFEPDSLGTSAPRLYVQDRNLSRYTEAGQTETLVHELVHAAGSQHTGPFHPAWVQEGAADWIAAGPSAAFPRGRGAGQRAPRDDQFGAGSQGQLIQAYRDSVSLIAELARLAGPTAPLKFFQQLGAEKVRPGGRAYVVDDSLMKIGAPSLGDLEKSWLSR